MYITSIKIQGYGPIKDLFLEFNAENIQPIVIFGLHGTGKSFLLNMLYQFLQKHHRRFCDEAIIENPIDSNKKRVAYTPEINVNLESTSFYIEINYIDENGSPHQELETFPPESFMPTASNFVPSINRPQIHYTSAHTSLDIGIKSPRQSHEEKIYLYFPSNRLIYYPSGYLPENTSIAPNYSLDGARQEKIIQDNLYDEIIVWLQHLIFQKYLLQATNGDCMIVNACLNLLESLLNDLLEKKWVNHRASLFLDSKNRRIFINLEQDGIRGNTKRIAIESLSQSELMILFVLAAILKRCEEHTLSPQNAEGIILIDSIEHSLDISTQMVYFPKLMKEFPKIQFIVSTCSLYFLQGMNAQYRQNFQLKQLSEQELVLDLEHLHDGVFFDALLKITQEKTKKEEEKEEEIIDDSIDIITPVDLDAQESTYFFDITEELDPLPLSSSSSSSPSSPSNSSSSSSSSSNSPPNEETLGARASEKQVLLSEVNIAEKMHSIFSKGLSLKIDTNFSVIAGRNGIGKTQLLKYIADNLTRYNRGTIAEDIKRKNGLILSGAIERQYIHILYYGCSKRGNIDADYGQRLQDYDRTSDQKADKFYQLYFKSRTLGTSQKEFSRLNLVEQEQYEKTVLLFNEKKPNSEKAEVFDHEIKDFFKTCAIKIIGVPIFLLAYPETFIQYFIEIMLPGELDSLNAMIKEKGFKYTLKTKKNINRHNSSKSDYFKLITDEFPMGIEFNDLSPGEQLELMTLTWLFNINYTQEKQAILLLDEPDAHLHPSLTHQVIREIKNRIVKAYGIQVIMTTHNPVTISMPEVEGHLFLMTDDNVERKVELNLARRRDINRYLMPYLISINPAFKLIFVEAPDDIEFYEFMYKRIYSLTGNLTAPLIFKAHGKSNPTLTFEKKGDDSSRGLVIRLVEKCVPESEDDTTLKDFMYGIVDNDNQDINTLPDNVYSPERYSIENYICDPLHVFFNLLERDPENNYALKLISEILKPKKGPASKKVSKEASREASEEEFLRTREIYLDVNVETYKLKYSVRSLTGERINGDLDIVSEILPSNEDSIKEFKIFLENKENEILDKLSSEGHIHRYFKEMVLLVRKESQTVLEISDPNFYFPNNFSEFSRLSPEQKTVIAQKIVAAMALIFYRNLERNPDIAYSRMIQNDRFKSKLIQEKSLNKASTSVRFLEEITLDYPKIFLHMQGHYLETLYTQFFGMLAGKASLLEFMKKNDVFIPQEFHQIFLNISNDGRDLSLQRTEDLKRIEEKESILKQWPSTSRKIKRQAEEIERFKTRQGKDQEEIKNLKEEVRKLKTLLDQKEIHSNPLVPKILKDTNAPSSSSSAAIQTQTPSINDAPNSTFFSLSSSSATANAPPPQSIMRLNQ